MAFIRGFAKISCYMIYGNHGKLGVRLTPIPQIFLSKRDELDIDIESRQPSVSIELGDCLGQVLLLFCSEGASRVTESPERHDGGGEEARSKTWNYGGIDKTG